MTRAGASLRRQTGDAVRVGACVWVGVREKTREGALRKQARQGAPEGEVSKTGTVGVEKGEDKSSCEQVGDVVERMAADGEDDEDWIGLDGTGLDGLGVCG